MVSAHVDEILAAGVARGAVPGVVAVVVDPGGVIHEGAFGERSLGSGIPMTTDTVGAIFSMTKALTAAAAMQLVEQGRLSLDAPASDVCPELADRPVLSGFDDSGQPVLRPASSPMTLRQLLTHTSGFGYDIWNADISRWHEVTGVPTMGSDGRAALAAPLVSDPGTRWHYGIGLDWAGVMIEVASGTTLGEYMAEHLTGPLGMLDTAFVPSASMLERRSAMHIRLPDDSLMPIALPTPERGVFESGGGGLHGTMADYGRFIRMMLADGELDGVRVLAADTVAEMSRNQIGGLRVEPMMSCQPGLSLDAEFFPGHAKSWGLSFQINEEPEFTGRPAGTLMWAGLSNSYYWIDRESGIGGAYLSQVLPFVDPASMGLFFEMERAVYTAR
jgi:methyl acetate hydrolase